MNDKIKVIHNISDSSINYAYFDYSEYTSFRELLRKVKII